MPNNYVEPGDAVRYLDSNGDEQIVAEYDEGADQLQVNDGAGQPADQKVGALEAKTIQNPIRRVYDSGIDFYAEINTAISDLTEGDELIVPKGTYDPISISTQDVTIRGTSPVVVRFDGSDGTAIGLNELRITVKNIFVAASGTGSENGIAINDDRCNVLNCYLGPTGSSGNHISVAGNDCRLSGLTRQNAAGGDSIVFSSGFSGSAVNEYINAGTITDNDGGNSTGLTT